MRRFGAMFCKKPMLFFLKDMDYTEEKCEGVDFREYCTDDVLYNYYTFSIEFYSANLRYTQFQKIYLRRAKFIATDLYKADFSGAYLHEANFKKAKIQGANFSDCEDIETANWDGAKYDYTTKPFEFFEKSNAQFEERKSRQRKKTIAVNNQIDSRRLNGIPSAENTKKAINNIILSCEHRQGNRHGRVHQKKFRQELLDYYNSHCCISGCSVETVLEAAHIKPYALCDDGEEGNRENGLLLRADIHTLFDLNLIQINPDTFIIEVHSSLRQIPEYFQFNKQPYHHVFEQSKRFLEWRYKYYEQFIGQPIREKLNINLSL